MSSHATESDIDEDDNGMELDPDPRPPAPDSSDSDDHNKLATLLRDQTNWLPNVKALQETGVIVLLTPVVIPISKDPTDTSDPFEPLGRALQKRQRRERIRHVPYTQRNGITSTHLGFIKRGHVIILCFVLQPGQEIQLEIADMAFAASDNKPCIIVVCCSSIEHRLSLPFPTVIQTAGYTPAALEAAAALIFSEHSGSMGESAPSPKLWPVEQWNEARDMQPVLDLWRQNMGSRFSIDHDTLASLLRRPGYAKHYVVRDSRTEEILGFCATYLGYVDQEGDKMFGYLAILLVRLSSRQQGIGLSLHNHAIDQLKSTRGVIRLQLGSRFPRIFYGPPLGIHLNEEWFRRRGWQLNKEVPGQGKAVNDLVLSFSDWRYVMPESLLNMPHFRPCIHGDMVKVLEMVKQVSIGQEQMGWYDQYSSLMDGPNVKDIVLGIEKEIVVSAALTYTPSCGSPVASNLPWAGLLGDDVGGVTCICINSPRDHNTTLGLLDACVKNLQSQGMRRMFLDGVTSDLDNFRRLGFVEWATYKDVWKDI